MNPIIVCGSCVGAIIILIIVSIHNKWRLKKFLEQLLSDTDELFVHWVRTYPSPFMQLGDPFCVYLKYWITRQDIDNQRLYTVGIIRTINGCTCYESVHQFTLGRLGTKPRSLEELEHRINRFFQAALPPISAVIG